MKNKFAVLVLMSLLLVLFAGCGGGFSTAFDDRSDAVFSPHGSVYQGDKAYSPDKKYYACEVEPYNQGNIAVFDVKTDKQVKKWQTLPNNNDLKGLAWSPDSKRVAVMYHGGMTPAVQVFKLGSDYAVASAYFGEFYHFMVFDKTGKSLLLAEDHGGSVTTLALEEYK